MASLLQAQAQLWSRTAAWFFLTIVCCPTVRAQSAPSPEYGVKAAFLLNFARFVEWPPHAFSGLDAPLEICVLGKDPFGKILDDVTKGESVKGRTLILRRITHVPAAQSCQTIFIATDVRDIAKILAAMNPATLTIGEGRSFLRDGGMIALDVENNRVRFHISQTAAEKAGLKVSSSLLQLARSVAR